MTPRHIVFCDFDGTITVEETLRKIFVHFIPDAAQPILTALDTRKITLREAVIQLVAAVPGNYQNKILDFVREEAIREGFGEFLVQLQRNNIPFVVISSGLRFYIRAMLSQWQPLITEIHALDVDTSGATMQAILPAAHPTEAMPKAVVMAQYRYDESIIIGDSGSDIEMAKIADKIFARDKLIPLLNERGLAFSPYQTFYDITDQLTQQGILHGNAV